MALGYTSLEVSSIGSFKMSLIRLVPDTSYPTGGWTVDTAQLGLSQIREGLQSDNNYGFDIVYNSATAKLMVFQSGSGGTTFTGTPATNVTLTGTNAPSALTASTAEAQTFTGIAMIGHDHNLQVVQAEAVAVAADTGTLANQPAAVSAVYATAGGSTGAKAVIPNGQTPGAGEVAINMSTGVLTFAAADAVTAASVNYVRTLSATTSAGTPAGTNAASAVSGTAAAQVWTLGAYTPAGTIGGAGSPAGEVPNGTNITATAPFVDFVFIGL